MAPSWRSLSSHPPETSNSDSSRSSSAAMLLLVMGYIFALTEKLHLEFKNLSNGSSDTPLAASSALAPTGERHSEGEVHDPDILDEGRQQNEPKQRHRSGSNRLEFSVAAFLQKLSSPCSSRQQQQQQQQQRDRAPAFAAPSAASGVYPTTAARRDLGSAEWAWKGRLGGGGIRSAPRMTQQERGLLPAAAASTSRTRLTDKTLCLGLDETLIHARSNVREMGEGRFDFMLVFPQQQQQHELKLAGTGQHSSTGVKGGGGGGGRREKGVEKEVGRKCRRFFVRKRPHLKEFLEAASGMFEVVLFTAAPAEFAQAVVEQIDPERKLVDHVLSRESCARSERDGSSSACGGNGRGSGDRGPASVVKDLDMVGRPLSKVIVVENSLGAIRYHLENSVHISGFCGDRDDTGLLSTLEALRALAPMADVRDGIIRLSVETQARKEGHTLMPDGSISPAP